MTYHRPAWYRRSREGFRDDAVRQEKKKQPSQGAITHFACQATMAEAHRNSTTYIINSTSLDPIHNKIVKPAEKPLSWARPSCLNSRSFFKIAVMQHRVTSLVGCIPYHRWPARFGSKDLELAFYRLKADSLRHFGTTVWSPCTRRLELRDLRTTIPQISALPLRNES